jgi:hypothetical protein
MGISMNGTIPSYTQHLVEGDWSLETLSTLPLHKQLPTAFGEGTGWG